MVVEGFQKSSIHTLTGPLPQLDPALKNILCEVRTLLGVSGASVLLVDPGKDVLVTSTAVHENQHIKRWLETARVPTAEGLAGKIALCGEPLSATGRKACCEFFPRSGVPSGFECNNILLVPLRIQEAMIGLLCAINKPAGGFDRDDVKLLTSVGNLAALTIQNVRMNVSLTREYENVRGLNQLKEQAIHHLSHEMKTPISVLAASLSLLEKQMPGKLPAKWHRIMDRARRSLQRLLDLQYEIGDMLRKEDLS